MADWLAETGNVPGLILCSPAERTQETAALMKASWSQEVPVSSSKALYLASPESILRVIRSDGCDANPLLVIAHNPGLGQLISQLAGQQIDVPTATIAVFDVAIADWGELCSDVLIVLHEWIQPKKLPDS